MSKNIDQVFIANPITSNTSTDLMYFGQSPYGAGNDAAMTFANFAGQFPTKANIQNQAFTSAVDSGSANVMAITLSPAPSAYVAGQLFIVRAANNNSGSTTLNVNGLGAKGVFTANGNACVGGEIVGGTTYLFEYNGAVNAFNLINPSNITVNQAPQIQNQKFVYAIDSGVANAYVIALAPTVTAPVDGQAFSFRAANTNTGSSTLDIGFGPILIVNVTNNALSGGEILAGLSYDVIFNSFIDSFILLNSSIGVSPVLPSQIQNQSFIYANDSGAINAYVITLSPAPASYVNGMEISFTAANSNNGNSTINVNGLGVVSISRNNAPLQGGEILAGSSYTLIYNTASFSFNLLNPSGPWFNQGSGSLASPISASVISASNSLAFGTTSLSGNNSFGFGSGGGPGNNSFSFGANISPQSDFSFLFGNSVGTTFGNSYNFAFGNSLVINNTGSWVIGDSNVGPQTDSTNNQWNATFQNGFRFFLTATIAPPIFSIDSLGNVINSKGEVDLSYTVLTPSTGNTITLATTNRRTLIDPAGTLATLTVNMPASPVDGQIQAFSFTQIITALTISGNGNTIKGNLASAAVGSSFTFIFDQGSATWYPTD